MPKAKKAQDEEILNRAVPAGRQVQNDDVSNSELDKLQTENTLLASEVDEIKADLQRVQADFVNFRRRSEEMRGEILDLARQDVALELLPLIDNIGRALGHLPAELQGNAWAQGVEQIARQADEALGELGIERIKSVGETFDPHLHEAVAQDGEGDTIIEELQPGYRMGDKVIRHAMVKVGKR